MNEIKLAHRKAMALIDLASLADQEGRLADAKYYRRKAYLEERVSADLVQNSYELEPTRSVLHRSAATLASQCGEPAEAERLIHRALSGTPPSDIAEELRDLLEQLTFERHLLVKGVELNNDEFQLSLSGNGVGYGFAPANAVLDRLNATSILLYRTAERRSHRPYREQGPPVNTLRQIAESYISVPRAASFAISLKVGRSGQLAFGELGTPELIVDEMLDCLEMFNDGKEAELRSRIDSESYYTNFIALARNLSPDGPIIRTVGLTAVRGSNRRAISLRRTWDESGDFVPYLTSAKPSAQDDKGKVTISGILKFADSRKSDGQLMVVSDDRTYRIVVPEGILNDIVIPLWNHVVVITGYMKKSKIHLETIRSST